MIGTAVPSTGECDPCKLSDIHADCQEWTSFFHVEALWTSVWLWLLRLCDLIRHRPSPKSASLETLLPTTSRTWFQTSVSKSMINSFPLFAMRARVQLYTVVGVFAWSQWKIWCLTGSGQPWDPLRNGRRSRHLFCWGQSQKKEQIERDKLDGVETDGDVAKLGSKSVPTTLV